MTEQAFKESEFYRKWAIAGMPADKQRLALAAWQAAQSVPGFVLVPVEFDADMMKSCILELVNGIGAISVGDLQAVVGGCQAAIKAYAAKAQEKKNGL